MKKNINLHLSYYLIILFLFAIFFLYQKHDVANDSTISEWLINYEGGFTKRGLIGQLSIYFANVFSTGLRDIIFVFQITTVGIYFYLIYYFFKNLELKRVFVFVIFTPIFILYPIAEIEVLARKELFIFIYFLVYTFIPSNRKNYKFYYKLIFLPITILIWEPVVFFILFFFFLDLVDNKINKFDKLFFIQIVSYFTSINLSIYIALNPISNENHALMANSLLVNFNENCYMSCALLKTKSSIYQQFQGNFGKYSIEIFIRYILIILIGFGPLFTLIFFSQLKENKIIFLKSFKKNNLLFFYLILLSPVLLLFAMGYDWGRWVNISYVLTLVSFFYLYKNNLIYVDLKKIKLNKLNLLKSKYFIYIFIIYAFTWNPKTVITGDVASFPLYRILYKFIKIYIL